jgi:hypothetical protein
LGPRDPLAVPARAGGPHEFRTVLRTTVIGFAALAILPARVGDVLRPYLLARREGLATTATMATVVMERVLDLIAVLTLLAIYVWGFTGDSPLPDRLLNPVKVSATLAAAVSVVLMAVMWVLATHPERIGKLAAAAARILPAASRNESASDDHVQRRLRGHTESPCIAPRDALVLSAVAGNCGRSLGRDRRVRHRHAVRRHVPPAGAPGDRRRGANPRRRRELSRGLSHRRDDVLWCTQRSSGRLPPIVTHAISFVPVVLLGVIFMAQDGLSVSGLKDLAGAARQKDEKEGAHTDEVPVLRPSGR